jgi:type VI secretion system protein ImpF
VARAGSRGSGAGRDSVRASILDRLIGSESIGPRGVYEWGGARELRAAVARDLEWLLNTKAWLPYDNVEGMTEARESILTYGVPDFSTRSWRSHSDSREIARAIETVIRRFEPRLVARSVKVEIIPSDDVADFRLKLRIDGHLHVDPISEPVSFDSDIDFDSGSFSVRGAV